MASETQPIATEGRPCPRCAETVQRAVLICRFCGYQFEPEKLRELEGTQRRVADSVPEADHASLSDPEPERARACPKCGSDLSGRWGRIRVFGGWLCGKCGARLPSASPGPSSAGTGTAPALSPAPERIESCANCGADFRRSPPLGVVGHESCWRCGTRVAHPAPSTAATPPPVTQPAGSIERCGKCRCDLSQNPPKVRSGREFCPQCGVRLIRSSSAALDPPSSSRRPGAVPAAPSASQNGTRSEEYFPRVSLLFAVLTGLMAWTVFTSAALGEAITHWVDGALNQSVGFTLGQDGVGAALVGATIALTIGAASKRCPDCSRKAGINAKVCPSCRFRFDSRERPS